MQVNDEGLTTFGRNDIRSSYLVGGWGTGPCVRVNIASDRKVP
jgi:hypothetical protein